MIGSLSSVRIMINETCSFSPSKTLLQLASSLDVDMMWVLRAPRNAINMQHSILQGEVSECRC